jgi:hypothetical protein
MMSLKSYSQNMPRKLSFHYEKAERNRLSESLSAENSEDQSIKNQA